MDTNISTQEMIQDSRARREQKIIQFTCEQCGFRSGSETLLKRHKDLNHNEINATTRKTYTSKRLKCEYCDKKFNKFETFKKHMKLIHKKEETVEIHTFENRKPEAANNIKIKHDLPIHNSEAQPRVTRQSKKNKTK